MKDFIKNIIDSLNNEPKGFSGKKLSAVAVMACIIVAHAKWVYMGDFTQLEMVLTINYTFIATMFGINVADKKLNTKKDEQIS
jgi:hypothetical protein